ncbi:MAG: type II secretion system protein [Burkholderiales bacterium]|nr:type II secretion system protein [Burkholderiales bacterium]
MRAARQHGLRGYTYIVVLVMLAVISMAAALTLELAETNARRAAETELFAVGKEFERAFASYYRQSPVGSRRFPDRLEDLTRDPRAPGMRRHLRRVYVDPLTGSAWGAVPAPGGGIMAVYSTAPGAPYREGANVRAAPLAASTPDATATHSYADWRFGYDPSTDLYNRNNIIRPTPNQASASAPRN